jgi:Recombinase zinc beta ribbon domain
MTVEEQKEILKTLKANDYGDKHRPGDGPALCQGRVVCGKCGAKLRVAYWDLRTSHNYRCCDAAVKWGDKVCMKVPGRELDKAVERMVLQVLESPPIQILKQALREATRAEEIKAREMDAERQRIERRERLVRAQFDACDPKYKLVYDDLQEQLDAVLKDIKRMEERLQAERLRPKLEVTEETLGELCNLASQIPQIWHHELVTNHERKEIIRCLIKEIIATTTPQTIEATIVWNAGHQTSFHLYRRPSLRSTLVKELHAQGYNSREIRRTTSKRSNFDGPEDEDASNSVVSDIQKARN